MWPRREGTVLSHRAHGEQRRYSSGVLRLRSYWNLRPGQCPEGCPRQPLTYIAQVGITVKHAYCQRWASWPWPSGTQVNIHQCTPVTQRNRARASWSTQKHMSMSIQPAPISTCLCSLPLPGCCNPTETCYWANGHRLPRRTDGHCFLRKHCPVSNTEKLRHNLEGAAKSIQEPGLEPKAGRFT